MLLFKRIHIARFGPKSTDTFDKIMPENEREELLEAFHRRAIGDDDEMKIESPRGWCSWGF